LEILSDFFPMVGNPQEPKTGHGLRLKKGEGAAPDGAGVCVSCGAPLPADAVICVRCGFDKRSGRHVRTGPEAVRAARNERHGGFLSAVLVFLIWIGLLSGLGYGLYEGYSVYEKARAAKLESDGSAAEARPWVRCPECLGQRKTKCATCGGFGSVETVAKAKCTQCGGTGKYSLMSKKTSTSCSFCRGTGYNEVLGREMCRACAGKGLAKCVRCDGLGKIH
jgi:hypothetical protein